MESNARLTRAVSLAAVLVVAMGLAACDREPMRTAASGSTGSTTPSEGSASAVVGEWSRINSCDSFVQAFQQAGLERLVPEWLVSAGYFVREDQVDPSTPCQGAVDDRNSYFFEPSGRFGSLDQDEVVVDDGMYAPLDGSAIAIVGKTSERRFRVDFRMANSRIRFHVSVPAGCTGACRNDLAWLLSMFYPGELMRVA
jgi:hypothetical protein